MSAQWIYAVVDRYGAELGSPLAPHDVRRTFANAR
jgi:hypothetical protein